jgi:hypothetical protein
MRRVLLILVVAIAGDARADLDSFDPDFLCGLLTDFGIETTDFAPVEGGRSLCYTVAHPGSIEGGYDFSYRVLGSTDVNRASLFIEARGLTDDFLGRLPQALFLEMSEHLLMHFFDPGEVQDVLAALRDVGPNERGTATGKGVRLQFYRIQRSLPGFPEGIEMRLTLSNTCAELLDAESREQCLRLGDDFVWRSRREQME